MSPEATTPLRERVAALLTRQEPHPVFPRLEVVFNSEDDIHHVTVSIGKELRRHVTGDEVLRMFTARRKMIHLEKADPYNHGYEPPMWAVVDWLIVQLRVEHPGEVIEVVILGGNRAGKTDYAAKRMCEVLDVNPWLLWAFHTDQSSSRAVQQDRFWKYLPNDLKPDSGKTRKGLNQRMNYNVVTGFTENCFSLPHGARCIFKFYSGDAKALEGDQPAVVWSDERIPLAWIEAIAIRLATRAGQTHAIAAQLKPLWEARQREVLTQSPRGGSIGGTENEGGGGGTILPKVMRSQMWQGVHLVTFTPLDGLTPAVAQFIKKAHTVISQPARQLPLIGAGNAVIGHEHMPRLKRRPGAPVAAAWFWNEDNKHGGNHEGLVKMARSNRWTEKDKKIKFYGYTEKAMASLFAKFDIDVHVKPAHELPREGTWYHIVDPCNGRNWFMIWVLVAPDNTAWVAYEWPPVREYVEGHGVLGEWVVDSKGKRMDGDPGPAQETMSWGCERYRDEIYRIEGKLWRMQHPDEDAETRRGGEGETRRGGEGETRRGGDAETRIFVQRRIMDSRYGNTANATSHGATKTIMDMMAELKMRFHKSGQTIAAEGEKKSSVSEGIQAINDLLDYNADLAKRSEVLADGSGGRLVPDPAQAPKMYVLEHCENLIWCGENYTGLDGEHGAGKDPVDVWRYFAILGARYIPPRDEDEDEDANKAPV